jgi:uncharacterized protein YkuJ
MTVGGSCVMRRRQFEREATVVAEVLARGFTEAFADDVLAPPV